MPGGDGTGPTGMGPMTGRGLGYCAGYPEISPAGRYYGRWGCRGPWRGRGWRGGWAYPPVYPYSYYPAATQQEQVEMLKSQAAYLENILADVNKQIKAIKTEL